MSTAADVPLPSHSLLLETPPLPGRDDWWSVLVQITFCEGRPIDWKPVKFVFRLPSGTTIKYQPGEIERPMPQLVERLCCHAELWFQQMARPIR